MELFSLDRMPERSSDGQFSHPDLDQFFDGEESPLDRERLLATGFVARSLYLDDDDAAEEIANKYYDGDELNLSGWNPQLDGWLLVCVWDTEDGPAALFVKKAPGWMV